MTRKYKDDISAAIHETALGFYEAGTMTKSDMDKIDQHCLVLAEKLSSNENTGQGHLLAQCCACFLLFKSMGWKRCLTRETTVYIQK